MEYNHKLYELSGYNTVSHNLSEQNKNEPLGTIECDERLPRIKRSDSPAVTNSKLKILLRGDILGALNCMFPDLKLVQADLSGRLPILDKQFSLFSDSNTKLQNIFSSAKQFRTDNKKLFIQNRKTNINEVLEDIIKSDLKQIHCEQFFDSLLKNQLNTNTTTTTAITKINSSTLRTKTPVDSDHQIFCDRLLVENYESMASDFKSIKRMIDNMDRAQVEYLKTKSIAPFNSNLPVLNISKATPSPPTPPSVQQQPPPPPTPPPATLKSDVSTTSKCSTVMPETNGGKNSEAVGDKSRATKKSAKRKRKRGGTRLSRAKMSPNKCSTPTNIDGHQQIENPKSASSEPPSAAAATLMTTFTADKSYEPCNEFERSIVCNLDALLEISDEEMFDRAVNRNSLKQPTTMRSHGKYTNPIKSTYQVYKEVTSLDIFRRNFENILKKNMEFNSNTKLRQKRQNQEQYELSVLYLRRKLDRKDSDCGIVMNVDSGNQITANGTLLVSNSAAAAVEIPTLRSASNATIGSIGSLSELEEEAIKQYRNSDESMEEKLAILEREAQEQYSY